MVFFSLDGRLLQEKLRLFLTFLIANLKFSRTTLLTTFSEFSFGCFALSVARSGGVLAHRAGEAGRRQTRHVLLNNMFMFFLILLG